MAKTNKEYELNVAPQFKKKGISGLAQNIDGHQRFLINLNKTGSEYLIVSIKPKDIERFAVNILRALKSKHLKK